MQSEKKEIIQKMLSLDGYEIAEKCVFFALGRPFLCKFLGIFERVIFGGNA